MEAINSLASVATKAIWGDNNTTTTPKDKDTAEVPKSAKEEPISGVQGDTSKGEPFDAGNMENVDDAKKAEAATVKKPDADPTVGDKPSSHMKDDSTNNQSDVREPADTLAHQKEEQNKDVDNVDPLDPEKLKGPGPKPLAEVARERGGSAGNVVDDAKTASSSSNPAEKTDSGDGEPLGQKHVSSTGVAADGGDFDAANPGAGAEADKILIEKGIHADKPPAKKVDASPDRKAVSPSGKSKGESPDRKGVRGLGRKIKDKLRRSSQS